MLSRVKEGLKSTVTNIGTALSNPLIREYEIGNHFASAGSGLSWKVYDGRKRSTGQEVSIWLFEKRQFDKMPKKDHQVVCETLKRGVQQLTRLRHPKLLIIEHGIEESRDSLAFATEPVFASLSNILGSHFNLPSPIPKDLKEYELFETELKYGLLQITEGLSFLHNDVKMIHGNICPDNVILNKIGAWKLSGFDCCMTNQSPTEQEPKFSFRGWEPDCPIQAKPVLDFLAPEYVLAQSADRSSDMFSLGMVFYTVFNRGRPLYENAHVLSTFQKNALQLSSLNSLQVLKCIPEDVREHVGMLLSPDPDVRPDANQLAKIPFFQDVGAVTLQYLDTLFQWDKAQRTTFYKGLKKVLEKMPERVLLQRVLPSIVQELNNKDMVLFVLPNVLFIAEKCSKEEYTTKVLPHLKEVFLMTEPIQIIYVCVQKLDVLLTKTPIEDVKSHLFPMLYKALDCDDVKIRELCLKVIPTFAAHVDFPTLKNHVIPRLKKICLETNILGIRINSLVCLGKLLEYLDRWYVQDEILPFVKSIPSHEPGVLMAILGIYQVTLNNPKLGMSKDTMATKGIPFLLPMAIDSQLNLTQFQKFMVIIKQMLEQIETEQTTKLEQISAYEKEQSQAIDHIMNQDGEENPDSVLSSILSEKPKDISKDLKKITTDLDELFGSASSPSDSPNKKSVVGNISNGTASSSRQTISTTVKQQPLTLEQKQKLMKDKAMMKTLENQNPLEANKLQVPQKTTIAPKNLTNSLGTSNVMGALPPATDLNTSGAPNYNISLTAGGISNSANPYSSVPANMSNKPNYMIGGTTETMSNSLVLHPMSQQYNQQHQLAVWGSQQSQQHTGPSSLDSLAVLPQSNGIAQQSAGGPGFGNMQYRSPSNSGFSAAPMGAQQRGMHSNSPMGAFPGNQNQLRPLATQQFSPQFLSSHQNNLSMQQNQSKSTVPLSNSDLDAFLK
ncbi:SCY1-like protein 2 [Convolutriloba macropyga]|uniref:SCY1-like protein 2 n=1 Tax=Convolutriloba macropyga TaxID=536237 RepID=UPI003F51BCE1